MSSKNRTKASQAHDRYPTPTRLVRAAFDRIVEQFPFVAMSKSFLEPGANTGVFCECTSTYMSLLRDCVGIEPFSVREKRFPYTLIKEDYCNWQTTKQFDFIATNPPFKLHEAFIRQSQVQLSPGGLMLYLLRLSALGSLQRQALWSEVNLLEVWVIRPRPSFTFDGGSDSSEYAFFLMDGARVAPSENVKLSWLDWNPDTGANTLVYR